MRHRLRMPFLWSRFTDLLLYHVLFSYIIVPVRASFDLVRCCVIAARDPNIMGTHAANSAPWNICQFGEAIVYPSDPLPSVQRTRAWCNSECPGYQHSEASQWLQPLATWIAPYIAFVLLCPIGGEEDEETETKDKPTRNSSSNFRSTASSLAKSGWIWVKGAPWEYLLLLGDPASALWGAFSEIIADCQLARRLSAEATSWFATRALWIAMLAGDTKYDHSMLWGGFQQNLQGSDTILHLDRPSKNNPTPWKSLAEHFTNARISNNDEVSSKPLDMDNIEPSGKGASHAIDNMSRAEMYSSLDQRLSQGVSVLVRGRIDFVKGIFLPVILTLAVAASVFFDAYGKLGDKDTAHALAYGIWYSWLITLCVSGNCFATSVNVGLARKAFGNSLSLSARRVSLSERYMNGFDWQVWLWYVESADTSKSNHPRLPTRNTWFWTKFVLGQLMGWACVAFACSCAAVVSWTTPTVGLGCRSFTFILYGIGTFIIALLHVLRQRFVVSSFQNAGGRIMTKVLTWTYTALVIFNAAVIVIGTTLHLSGVYRSCQCSRLFGKDDTLLEFNRNTELSITNARKYWLVTGYVAFSFVWLVCANAVAARKYIMWKMEAALEASSTH